MKSCNKESRMLLQGTKMIPINFDIKTLFLIDSLIVGGAEKDFNNKF